MSVADLRRSKEDEISVLFNPKNKVYVQNFKTLGVIHGANVSAAGSDVRESPGLINLFPEVTIQAGKSFTIDAYVKTYPIDSNADNTWMGLSIATNVKINGVWYSLGSSGRNVSAILKGSGMATYVSKKYVDFQNLLTREYVDRYVAYTVQVELVGSCHENSQVAINYSLAADATVPTSPGPVESISDQNYTTIIIEETD